MNKQVIQRQKVWGNTKEYEVCLYDDGSYSCNCPAWIFHKGERVNCKHIKELIQTQIVWVYENGIYNIISYI
jgi:hypothetical protein